MTGLDPAYGSIISCIIALFIFWYKEVGKAIDGFTKILGLLMIVLTLYIVFKATPPIGKAIYRSFIPEQFSALAIVTLVGGTVGGYISFAGGHRLLDAGIKGEAALAQVNKSAISGIVITSIMRFLLFLCVLGVINQGLIIDAKNPPASVFQLAAGNLGYRFFGIVMWAAAITSVVGAAYTSVSFIKTFQPWLEKNEKWVISFFIVSSTLAYQFIGNPVKILVTVGALNGLILPIALTIILLAATKKKLVQSYKHPLWLSIAGWIVVVAVSWMSGLTLYKWIVNF